MTGQLVNTITTPLKAIFAKWKKVDNSLVDIILSLIGIILMLLTFVVILSPMRSATFKSLQQMCKDNTYSITYGCDIYAIKWSTLIALLCIVGTCCLLFASTTTLVGWHRHLATGQSFRNNEITRRGRKTIILALIAFSLVGLMYTAAFSLHIGMPSNTVSGPKRSDIPHYNGNRPQPNQLST